MYDSILLLTIRVPKMLMHLTEHLPDSKYDSNDGLLRLFGAGSKKRNTTGMDMNKVVIKSKKRGASEKEVMIPTNDSEYQSVKAKLKPIVSPKGGLDASSQGSTLGDHDLITEEKSSIIKRIIKVKQDLDSELARMAAPE